MYDSAMVADLSSKFVSAKTIELLNTEEFQVAMGHHLGLFKALHDRMMMTKLAYDKQFEEDQKTINSHTDMYTYVTKGSNFLLWCCAGFVGYKIVSKLLFDKSSSATNVNMNVPQSQSGGAPDLLNAASSLAKLPGAKTAAQAVGASFGLPPSATGAIVEGIKNV